MTQPALQTGPASAAKDGLALVPLDSALFKDVRVELTARLGVATLTVEELLNLKAGSVVKLEARLNDLVELRLNGQVVALGEIVAVGERFGLRIVEVAPTP